MTHPHKNHALPARSAGRAVERPGAGARPARRPRARRGRRRGGDRPARPDRPRRAARAGCPTPIATASSPAPRRSCSRPSTRGSARPVLEAMALGTPVICSDRAALPEVAGDAALVRPLDRDAWATALDEVAARRGELIAAGRRARRAVHDAGVGRRARRRLPPVPRPVTDGAPGRPLRIVVLGPHFEPDTAPTGRVLTRIVEELAARGHELHVVAALPWYLDARHRAGVGRAADAPGGAAVGHDPARPPVPGLGQAQPGPARRRVRRLLAARRVGRARLPAAGSAAPTP